jgi:Phosphoglycerate dehydrogenase and related dehydrogenases
MAQRIVITEFMDAPAVEKLAARFDVEYRPKLVDDAAALEAALAQADAWIVRNRTQGTRPRARGGAQGSRDRAPGGGPGQHRRRCLQARGIAVIPATGANAESVAEYVIAVALVLLRGAYFSSGAVASGSWPREALTRGREISGKRLGLVGFGGIGRLTAQKAHALGMRVAAYDPQVSDSDPSWSRAQVEPRGLDALLADSDVISLHVPLTAQTQGLFDRARLARMKPDAVLVNTSRGGIVDESALAAALREGRLAGAALDVFTEEPLRAGSALEGAPRLILTPHVAGVTAESNERVSELIAMRVAEALSST